MKKIFITAAMASMLCMGFVSCADELNIKSIDPQSSPTYTAEGLLAKQYATLGLTGQKGAAGSADLSGDEGESGFIRTVFNLEELMTDEILWAWQDNEGIAAITHMNWDKSNARVNWAYQRLIFDITLYNQFISEQTGKMSEDKIAEVRFLRALNYYYFLDLYRKAPFKETFDSNLPIEKSGKDLYEWLDNELTTIEPMMAEVGAYNNSENFGRADRGAAYALHARLALNSAVYTDGQVKDYQKAIDYCDKIIDSGNPAEASSVPAPWSAAVSDSTAEPVFRSALASKSTAETVFRSALPLVLLSFYRYSCLHFDWFRLSLPSLYRQTFSCLLSPAPLLFRLFYHES